MNHTEFPADLRPPTPDPCLLTPDLPIGDSRVELTVRTFQYRCAACERCFTPPCAALADGDAQSRATHQLIIPDLESLARWREPGRGAERVAPQAFREELVRAEIRRRLCPPRRLRP